jgi:hypothetical protein
VSDAGAADQVSPFPEWETLRLEIVPYVGERALSLLAFAVFDEADGFEGAAYFREALRASGTDVDSPEVTESESLLIRWGRLFARDSEGIPADVQAEFDRVFNPQLRTKLVEFAALTVATATTEQQ